MCMFDSCVPELTFYYISTIYKDTISELGNTAVTSAASLHGSWASRENPDMGKAVRLEVNCTSSRIFYSSDDIGLPQCQKRTFT